MISQVTIPGLSHTENCLYYCFRENCEITYNPGGCVLNTLRIIQALVQQPSYCVFFGGLGNDKEGELLETEVKKSGVEAR